MWEESYYDDDVTWDDDYDVYGGLTEDTSTEGMLE